MLRCILLLSLGISGLNVNDILASTPETSSWPRVSFIGSVAENIIEVRVQTGEVIPPSQTPYMPRSNDIIRNTKQGRSEREALYQNGSFVGWLIGNRNRKLFTPAKVVKAPFDPSLWQYPDDVGIVSNDDARYAEPTPVVAINRKSRPYEVARIDGWKFDAPIEHIFYFTLPDPMVQGSTYRIILAAPQQLAFPIPSFTYEPERKRSEAIHMSQIGFRVDDPSKLAFVSTWMGDGDAVNYSDLEFRVVRQEDRIRAYVGKLDVRKAHNQPQNAYSRNRNATGVYVADFSDLNLAGTYKVCVKSVGCSFPFEIHRDVWTRAFKISAKGFYTQRRSIPIGLPYSKFERPENLDPSIGTRIYQSMTPLLETGNGPLGQGEGNFARLVAGATDERCTKVCWGGWMDAGDWDSRIQQLIATTNFVELVEFNPDFFSEIDLNIPESGNDLPDLIDEALFSLDHFRRMQLSDGGIRGGIESEEHPIFGEASWQESQTVYVYAADVWSSYLYAAAAARTAHLFSEIQPSLTQVYLDSAVRAWLWAEARVKSKAKVVYQIRDARNYAAAALYRLTGEAAYHEIFRETTVFNNPYIQLVQWGKHDQKEANWIYLNTDQSMVDKGLQENCRMALLHEADNMLQQTRSTDFGWASKKWTPIGWGTLTRPNAKSMLRAHWLTQEVKYLGGAITASQSGLGANALNMAYTTGIGVRFPMHPLHVDSYCTNQPAPHGLTLFGPLDTHHYSENERAYVRIIQKYVYPNYDSWPVGETFWNMAWYPAISEYSVHGTMAENAYVWGYLAARESALKNPAVWSQ